MLIWRFWEAFFEELQAAAIDAYWQAEYEAVCRELDRESSDAD
jgi:hypothetical protein